MVLSEYSCIIKCLCIGCGINCDLSSSSQVNITAIICSLVFLLLGMFLGGLLIYCFMRLKGKLKVTISSPAAPTASAPAIYEEVPPDSHTDGRKNVIELSENVAYGPVGY